MPTLHLHRPAATAPLGTTPASSARTAPSPWWWLAGGCVVFFAVPYLGTDVLGLQPDLYYLAYFTVAVVWFAAFWATYRDPLRTLWRRHWPWSLAVGALAGLAVGAIVFGSESTGHPDGWRWWFEIGWRGIVYGAVDALTLFVFPAAVAYLLMHGKLAGLRRASAYAGLALALSLLVSTSYHLGYPEYRGSDLRSPLIGTVMANSATILTGNPVGALLTHPTAHVSAVVHQEQGGPTHMLPPQVTGDYPARGSQDVAAGLAGVWLLAVAGGVALLVRRERSGGPNRT